MTKATRGKPDPLSARGMGAVLSRLADGKPVRRSFSDWGRIHIDRPLPFLCVYRKPRGSEDVLTGDLVSASASYLVVSGEQVHRKQLVELVRSIAAEMAGRFGAFLILEIWPEGDGGEIAAGLPPAPGFHVCVHPDDEFSPTAQTLTRRLETIRSLKQRAEVSFSTVPRVNPPGMAPLATAKMRDSAAVHTVGIGVRPVYLDAENGETFPLLHQAIKRQFARALDQAFYEFARERTSLRPSHYNALGRRAMVAAVWSADGRLAEVAGSYDLLYQVTPVNADRAWTQFKRHRCERAPLFVYRPRPVDPGQMKRTLFGVHIERVEDPTLMHLFIDKQIELERELTMLHDLGTRNFLYGSMLLHGRVSSDLLKTARLILDETPVRTAARGPRVSGPDFARRAVEEIAWYEQRYPGFPAKASVAEDMYSGLMVTGLNLLVGKGLSVPEERVDALLQHEVGTHLVTYVNGLAQPFKMLSTGMPGYEELQEGMAVIAEYLVGGMSLARLRVLAARVVAASELLDGATFVDVHRSLHREYGFSQRTAYTITMRIFRGGGFLKDAVYLRGLELVLRLLADGEDLDILYAGKIGGDYLNVVRELVHRRILGPARIRPRYMELPETRERLLHLGKAPRIEELLVEARR